MRSTSSALLLIVAIAASPASAGEAPPTDRARQLAAGVHFIPGEMSGGRQPDGNLVILEGSRGLILIDTGRHAEHTQKALDLAAAAGAPIRAVINTHWHLDHTGGNPRVRLRYPDVRIFASDALEGAMVGFLADYRAQLEVLIPQSADDPQFQDQLRGELAILDSGPLLAPDRIVARSRSRRIAGRRLALHLESRAVTAGDVWILDPATRILVAGDLVTLPVPLFDTACPEGWAHALERLAGEDFDLLVPGHGEPMTREAFGVYRAAFTALVDCAASEQPVAACVDGWFRDAGALATTENAAYARDLAAYYVGEVLRGDPAKLAARCAG